MSFTDDEKTPVVIIAYRKPGNHLVDTFQNLKLWFENIVVVGPENPHISRVIKENGGSWIVSESPHIFELWETGIRVQNSVWYILIQDKEYLSSVLKENITETIRTKPVPSYFYPFDRKSFFLKQRLKYNMNWACDPPSGLLFIPNKPESLAEILKLGKAEHLKGELIHFGERTLNEASQNAIDRANFLAGQLYKESSDLNKRMLVIGAVKNSLKNFFITWLVRKGMREGFEGLVFCLLDSITILLGHLRYYEKYIRSGKQIENNRTSIKKILIIKIRGLGDAVLATPVFKNLKALMPNVSISVLTFNFCKPLFENNPNIDELYGLSEKPEALELKQITADLSAHNFDLIINLHSRNLSSRLTKNIKARWRINRSYFIREKFSDVMIGSDHEFDKSSIERDLDCIRSIGLKPIKKQPELYVTDEESEWANGYLVESGLDREKKIIMIHPAVTQPYRHWGMDRFIELSRKLIQGGEYQVMGIFSKMEQSIAKNLLEKVEGVFVYVGALRQSMALIQQADLMIDNDSGPAHVAQALKVPTLVLVGPDYKNSYRDSQVYGNNDYVFYQDTPCRDLFFSKCLPPDPCQNRICMDHSVEAVFAKAKELLKKPSINLK